MEEKVVYRIAICEDEAGFREELVGRCKDILKGMSIPHHIVAFDSAEKLESVLSKRPDSFDLLLLDIQLPGKTGVDLGISLRRINDRVGIVFVTGNEAYALEGYKAQPCNYLMKPVSDEALKEALKIELKRQNRHQTVVFQDKGRVYRLKVSDIRYVESYDHGIRINTIHGTLSFYITLLKAKEILPMGVFARCHNSFIVNLSKITSVTSTKVIFMDGEQIPVGRSFREEFNRLFINHFF